MFAGLATGKTLGELEMDSSDSLRDILKASGDLTKRGEHHKALKLLDESIAQAQRTKRYNSVIALSIDAAAISRFIRDFGRVKRYCNLILSHDPDNALALYSIADALQEEGEGDAARAYASKSLSLALHNDTQESRSLAELLVHRWPELSRSPEQS